MVNDRGSDAWRVGRRVQRLAKTQIGAATGGLALCDPTRGRALSEDTPPVRAPWSMTEVVTCVVVERWCGKKKWVEGACSEVDAGRETDGRGRFNRAAERCYRDTRRINRRKTADGRVMPKAVSQGGVSGTVGCTVWVSMPDSRRDRRRSRSRKSKPLRTDHRLGRGHIDRAR